MIARPSDFLCNINKVQKAQASSQDSYATCDRNEPVKAGICLEHDPSNRFLVVVQAGLSITIQLTNSLFISYQ
jgi:hypothetical protein